jgi:hypothetical protein
MASNWIKIEVITPDKPEIYELSELLSLDPDAVLGKLIRIWAWADQQTIDGNAKSNATSVTKIAIDRMAFMPGFADAMLKVGWLKFESTVLVFPNFERHNGESSKKRALTNRRVAKHRTEKQESNADSVTGSVSNRDQKELPEEEEEEEEDKDLKPPLNPPKGKKVSEKFDPLSVELPGWLSAELWAEWVGFRKELKKPIKTLRGVTASIKSLDEYRAQGHSPESVINHCIANEYQGLYAPQKAAQLKRDINQLPGPDKQIPAGFRGARQERDINQISEPDSTIPPGFRG